MINLEDWDDYRRSHSLVSWAKDFNSPPFLDEYSKCLKYPIYEARMALRGFENALKMGRFVAEDEKYVAEKLLSMSEYYNPESDKDYLKLAMAELR